jgi:hypothetical protein
MYGKLFLGLMVALIAATAFGQGWQADTGPVINQNVIQQQGPMPGPASAMPQPLAPPTYEGWRDGWTEKWEHTYRPLRERDHYPQIYNQNVNNGYYYNPGTGNFQRDVWQNPSYQYQPVYQYPAPTIYNGYCQPVYRRPSYCWPW